ncbi:MAG TPA: extracellular solute-binding protein [Candidatus Eisenbergiella merdigallinarum]|uniref:Extracellular solute-binding protein n=1 Tax=Candidatus Eisenbergiella merdigallinarum TaxID=2838552 RepID=A0A9D2MSG0_9FIRM|nr:extracellular solute-binding protein [Candidatus Eisenbergiella merdigallinarum]
MKQLKRMTALGLAAVMAVSAAACSGGNGGDSASSGEEQTNFSIFAGISALSPDNSEKPLVQQMNEAMGVTIEWNCVSGDTLTEKKNLILNAGSDLPDALMAASLTDNELLTYGGNGLLIPLEDYINEETMPNLMKIVEKRPEMLATCTMPDGHIYGLPGISEMGFQYSDGNTYYIGAIPQFTAINTDWLEAVDMEMPTTVDELHDVLVAFKENDVNGNGDPTDEIPLSFIFPEKNGSWCAGIGTLLAPFGCTDYQADHRAIEDGKVYYQAATEEYKNAIAYYHEWFEEGLIDIEIFSQDSSQYIAKGNGEDPRLGVFVWWEIPEVVGEERAESYEYLPILEGPDGTYGVNLNEMGTTSHNSFAVTNACKNPELLLKWVDQMYDPINSMQAIYGPIGVYWDEEPDENGCYSMRELQEGETAGELKSKSELLGPTEQLAEDYGTYYYMEDRAQERLNDLNDFWFQYVDSTEYYPSVTNTAEEIEVINDKLSDIKALTEEKVAHWLRDGGIEEEWDQYLQDLDNMGLSEVVAAWQAAYDRYQKALAK